jgi:hypothetical protein
MGRSGKAVFDPKKGNDMTRSNFISYFLDSTLEAISRIGDHANYSWLEATPTTISNQLNFSRTLPKQFVGAASCRDIRVF